MKITNGALKTAVLFQCFSFLLEIKFSPPKPSINKCLGFRESQIWLKSQFLYILCVRSWAGRSLSLNLSLHPSEILIIPLHTLQRCCEIEWEMCNVSGAWVQLSHRLLEVSDVHVMMWVSVPWVHPTIPGKQRTPRTDFSWVWWQTLDSWCNEKKSTCWKKKSNTYHPDRNYLKYVIIQTCIRLSSLKILIFIVLSIKNAFLQQVFNFMATHVKFIWSVAVLRWGSAGFTLF